MSVTGKGLGRTEFDRKVLVGELKTNASPDGLVIPLDGGHVEDHDDGLFNTTRNIFVDGIRYSA